MDPELKAGSMLLDEEDEGARLYALEVKQYQEESEDERMHDPQYVQIIDDEGDVVRF